MCYSHAILEGESHVFSFICYDNSPWEIPFLLLNQIFAYMVQIFFQQRTGNILGVSTKHFRGRDYGLTYYTSSMESIQYLQENMLDV